MGWLCFQSVNSYTLTPDGQTLIYSVTMKTQDDRFYANLFMKGASERAVGFSQLTRGTRFLDVNPTTSWEEGSKLVVFQSNRGPLDSWDISSFRLQEGRIIGGIQQLTRNSSLNYGPVFTSEHQEIYFSSIEEWPGAEPIISFVRADGSGLTSLGESGESIDRTSAGVLYFVRMDEDSKKRQIFSMNSDGTAFTSVINDVEFMQSHCFAPSISPDGKKLLFVSDYHQDEKGRNNNNLYIFVLDTGRIQQVTDNGSDDIEPKWSPTEPGIIYFLTNRGGIYNIWRMKIVGID